MERLGGNKNTKLTVLGPNTAVVGEASLFYPVEAPEKISKRLRLNSLGLNGLATVVVAPACIKSINNGNLEQILEFSNQINEKLGLPPTNDLVIRTSAQVRRWGLNVTPPTILSEPALLISNLQNNPIYQLLGKNIMLTSLQAFIRMLPGGSFFLIHDDNNIPQIEGLHGSIYEGTSGTEIYLRTGSLHARDMGDPSNHYPTIRINAARLEDLFEVTQSEVLTALQKNETTYNIRRGVRILNCTPDEAIHLTTCLHKNTELIFFSYKNIEENFGVGRTSEFRIYPQIKGWVGQKLHVLDVN